MQTGNETWKWGAVFILFAIFILVANQAYLALSGNEDFAPPKDWQEGDSYDIEHKAGPGAGQPMDVPPSALSASETLNDLPSPTNTGNLTHPELDWNTIKDPSQE